MKNKKYETASKLFDVIEESELFKEELWDVYARNDEEGTLIIYDDILEISVLSELQCIVDAVAIFFEDERIKIIIRLIDNEDDGGKEDDNNVQVN